MTEKTRIRVLSGYEPLNVFSVQKWIINRWLFRHWLPFWSLLIQLSNITVVNQFCSVHVIYIVSSLPVFVSWEVLLCFSLLQNAFIFYKAQIYQVQSGLLNMLPWSIRFANGLVFCFWVGGDAFCIFHRIKIWKVNLDLYKSSISFDSR